MEIPEAAKSVAEIIKRDVPRPKAEYFVKGVRWIDGPPLVAYRDSEGRCPMGMHPKACISAPIEEGDFPADDLDIQAFGKWWDSIFESDLEKAIEAIWGKP